MKTLLEKLWAEWKPYRFVFATFSQAESAYYNGQISARLWNIYCLFWIWSSPRWGSTLNADCKQAKMYSKRGIAALDQRRLLFCSVMDMGF
jgi:hypothetical protein